MAATVVPNTLGVRTCAWTNGSTTMGSIACASASVQKFVRGAKNRAPWPSPTSSASFLMRQDAATRYGKNWLLAKLRQSRTDTRVLPAQILSILMQTLSRSTFSATQYKRIQFDVHSACFSSKGNVICRHRCDLRSPRWYNNEVFASFMSCVPASAGSL